MKLLTKTSHDTIKTNKRSLLKLGDYILGLVCRVCVEIKDTRAKAKIQPKDLRGQCAEYKLSL